MRHRRRSLADPRQQSDIPGAEPLAHPFAPRPFTSRATDTDSPPLNTTFDFAAIRPPAAQPASQPKLVVGAPDSAHEHEAERAAARVAGKLRPTIPTPLKPAPRALLQPASLSRAADSNAALPADPAVVETIGQAQGRGAPLDGAVRAQMEQDFGGVNFGGVRVHTGQQADWINQAVQARAATVGNNIFFRQGAYAPGRPEGRRLLAHELTHVMQQSGGGELIQRTLAANTYVSTPAPVYLKVVSQIKNHEVVRVKTGNVNRIISTQSGEYEHMRRAPVPITTEPIPEAETVYQLRDARTGAATEYRIETDLQEEPDLTWAMGVTNHQLDMALKVKGFVEGLPSGSIRTDTKDLLALAGGNGPQIDAIISFCDRHAEPPELKEATTILKALHGDVVGAQAALDFLASQDPAQRGLARRELESAGFDAGAATQRMAGLDPLLATARTQASARAEETYTTAVEQAQTDKDSAVQQYRQQHAQELPPPPSKSQAKSKKRKPLSQKHQQAVQALNTFESEREADRTKAVEAADKNKGPNESSYLAEEIGFVEEITVGAQNRATVTQLAALVNQNKGQIRALQAMMLDQADIDDLTLAKSVATSGLDVAKLAGVCRPLLPTLNNPGLVFATGALIVETDSQQVKAWVQNEPSTVKASIVAELRKKQGFIAPMLAAYQKLGHTSLFYDCVAYIEAKKIKSADKLNWLFSQHAVLNTGDFSLLLNHVAKDNQSLAEIENIFAINNAANRLNKLSVKDLLSLIGNNNAQGIVDAFNLVPPGEPVQIVQMVLKYTDAKVAQASAPLFKLLRIKGELAYDSAGARAMIAVSQADTTYAHGLMFSHADYGKDRTGFLSFTFRNGDTADIHTHWNVNTKQIVSMHVQVSGGNGVEVNQWGNWFGDVRDLIKWRQNNAPAGMGPSIAPLISTATTGHYPDRHRWTRANNSLS